MGVDLNSGEYRTVAGNSMIDKLERYFVILNCWICYDNTFLLQIKLAEGNDF